MTCIGTTCKVGSSWSWRFALTTTTATRGGGGGGTPSCWPCQPPFCAGLASGALGTANKKAPSSPNGSRGQARNVHACGATSISRHKTDSLCGRPTSSCSVTGAPVATSVWGSAPQFFAPSAGPLCLRATARISAARALCRRLRRLYFRFVGLATRMLLM